MPHVAQGDGKSAPPDIWCGAPCAAAPPRMVGITGSYGVLYLDSRAARMLASTRAVWRWYRVERRVPYGSLPRLSFASTFAGMRGQQSRGRADG